MRGNLSDRERAGLIQSVWNVFRRGDFGIEQMPQTIKSCIEFRAWEKFESHGQIIRLNSLREMITLRPIKGLGLDPDRVEALIRHDPQVLAMWRSEMAGKHGGDRKSEEAKIKSNNVTLDPEESKHPKEKDGKNSNNVTIKSEESKPHRGNARAYNLQRVQRECPPEVVEKVMAGKVSPHKALVEAGVRQTRQVYAPKDPAKLIPKLRSVLGDDYVDAALAAASADP